MCLLATPAFCGILICAATVSMTVPDRCHLSSWACSTTENGECFFQKQDERP